MSDDPRSSTRFRIVLFIVLALPIAAIGVVLRTDQPFTEEPIGDQIVPEVYRHVPYSHPLLSVARITQIAIEEVKKREGWYGKADPPKAELSLWFVTVRRGPKSTDDWSDVVVEGYDGSVVEYRNRKRPLNSRAK